MKSLHLNRQISDLELYNSQTPISSGFQALDQLLPLGGWDSHTINELVSAPDDLSQLAILAPTLAKLSQQGRWIVLVGAPKFDYKTFFLQFGIASDKVLMVHPKDQLDALWATEQALMTGTSSAVLAWPGHISRRDMRRLQLASKSAKALAFVFQNTDGQPQAQLTLNHYSPSACPSLCRQLDLAALGLIPPQIH